jgi:haloacetate dehalogenase
MFKGFQARRIKTSNAEIAVKTGGHGPALLLLHGYPQTHAIWHKVAPELADRFSLVIPDLRGYGDSIGPKPDPEHLNYSKRAMARDMIEIMDALGQPRFRLAGHDRGARVAYRLALDFPERVKKLAILDVVPTLDVWEQMGWESALGTYHWPFLAVPAPVPEKLIGSDPIFYLHHLLQRWAGKKDCFDPAAIASYEQSFSKPSVIEATCEDYRAGAGCDREHDLADRKAGRKVQCPLLVIWGTGYLKDKIASPAETWRKWANDVREVALECGHFIAEEEPQACAKAMREFFTNG